ncbi:hypothetical protein SRHO_G00056850 [Serrasalmus rhombeus]
MSYGAPAELHSTPPIKTLTRTQSPLLPSAALQLLLRAPRQQTSSLRLRLSLSGSNGLRQRAEELSWAESAHARPPKHRQIPPHPARSALLCSHCSCGERKERPESCFRGSVWSQSPTSNSSRSAGELR